jgi:superoxide dismutase, Fe-Mn family
MKKYIASFSLVFIFILIIETYTATKAANHGSTAEKKEQTPAIFYEDYVAKHFQLDLIPFLSKKQAGEHYELYKGYVNKYNEIHQRLLTAEKAPGITYSQFRELKIEETFALDAIIFHELYFENMINGKGTKIGMRMKNLIAESFSSDAAYLQDLRDCAACARGWAITGYLIPEQRIYNYVLDAHNMTVPARVIPLVVIDVYEHAYMIDFGINRATYLNQLFESINWTVIEERIAESCEITGCDED